MEKRYDTWVEIDLNAIRHNIQTIALIAGKPVMAIIKANAYGHGMIPVGKAAIAAGCPFVAVARFGEAQELRQAGITAPILVLGYIHPKDIEEAARESIRATLFSYEQMRQYEETLRGTWKKLPIHVKVDVGMGRLGEQAEDGLRFLQNAASSAVFDIEGLYSHFSKADMLEDDATGIQFSRFDRLIREAEKAGLRPRIVHLANSAGAVFHPEICKYDMVRGGIAIYGLDPSDSARLSPDFQPALSWKAGITSVKTVPAGQEISYCGRYKTQKDNSRIGVIPVGYADGFGRILENRVLVHGRRVPVLGTVCMDQCMIDLNEVPYAVTGDEAVILGSQGDDRISAEELGARWHTINYDVVCGIAERVTRLYTPELS